ncbi:MAG: PaaI family thioesterase [Actinomycetota bacterium]
MADTAQQLTIEPAIWKEEVRGGHPDGALFGLSGIEQLRTFFRGKTPLPPIHHLTGMRPTHVGPAEATFVMPATDWLQCPTGYITLGVLAMVADGGLGCAVQSVLPPATPYTTSDLSLSFLRPSVADGGLIAVRGRVIHAGRSLAVAEAMIEDGEGRPLAHGTTRCFVLPSIDPPPTVPDELPDVPPASHDSPDPYLRTPAAGAPVAQEVWDRMTGLEVMGGWLEGTLPPPPISHLTGLRPVDVGEGRATFALPSTGWLTSPLGTVQGGAIALIADTVLACAAQTTIPRRTTYSPLDLKVNFLRPVSADGRDLVATGTVIHRGRTLAVAQAEVQNADGKPVAVATGTALIREGAPWRPAEEPATPDA